MGRQTLRQHPIRPRNRKAPNHRGSPGRPIDPRRQTPAKYRVSNYNSVGMAMQILDTISGEAGDLQDRTKAELVKLFVGGQAGDIPKRAEADKATRRRSTRH